MILFFVLSTATIAETKYSVFYKNQSGGDCGPSKITFDLFPVLISEFYATARTNAGTRHYWFIVVKPLSNDKRKKTKKASCR